MRPLIAPLFVPASRPDRFAKAALSGADAIIIDLEDAVPPALKEESRSNLGAAAVLTVPAIVRINGDGTDWYEPDLDALVRLGIRLVCVPKVECTGLLDSLALRLGADVELIAQVETARGVENAAAIAAHRSVRQLAFGPADFFFDMGMPVSTTMTSYVLSRLATASRAAGLASPLDGPCFAIGEPAALLEECTRAIACGAGGKLCIHPLQPAKVRGHFLPPPEEIEWARRVAAADHDGRAQIVDGRMIDAPLVARARAVLERVQPEPHSPACETHERQEETRR